jgi:hypothetical protein
MPDVRFPVHRAFPFVDCYVCFPAPLFIKKSKIALNMQKNAPRTALKAGLLSKTLYLRGGGWGLRLCT